MRNDTLGALSRAFGTLGVAKIPDKTRAEYHLGGVKALFWEVGVAKIIGKIRVE